MTSRDAAARVLIAAGCALLIGFMLLWLPLGHTDIGRSDFTSSYMGGTLLREGHAGELYNETLQTRLHDQLIAPDREGNLPFVDSPIAAVLVLPVTVLPLDVAYRVWSLLELAVLLLAVVIAVRSAPWPERTANIWKVAAGATAMASVGTWTGLLQAQWTPLIALGLALAYREWRGGRLARGAVALTLAAAVAKPHLALGLLAFVLGWRQRRVLLGAGAAAASVALASLAVVGPAGIAGFLTMAAGSTTRWDLRTMISFVGLPGSLLGNVAAAHAIGAAGSLAACLLAYWMGGAVRRQAARLVLALSGAAVLSVLAAPHALSHDLVMLAPVMVWGIALALRGGQAAGATPRIWARVATLVATWVVINAAVLTDVADGGALPPGQLSALALLLGVLLTCHELRRPRAANYAPVGSPAPSPSPAVGTSFSARAT